MRETKFPKLNTEQKKLVEENHNLIYGFMTRYHLDFEEWYDICAIGLCKAGVIYDGTAKFSTLSYMCMYNEMVKANHLAKMKKRCSRDKVISLDTTTVRTVGNEDLPLEAIIPSESKNAEHAIGWDWVDWFIEYASTVMLKVLYAKLTDCKTCQQVADKFNVSREAVNKQMRALQKHYREGTRPYCLMRYDNKEEREEMRNKVKKELDKLSSL